MPLDSKKTKTHVYTPTNLNIKIIQHLKILSYLFILCVYWKLCCRMHMWRSENNLQESVLSVHHVGPGKQTRVSGLAVSEYLYLPTGSPHNLIGLQHAF